MATLRIAGFEGRGGWGAGPVWQEKWQPWPMPHRGAGMDAYGRKRSSGPVWQVWQVWQDFGIAPL